MDEQDRGNFEPLDTDQSPTPAAPASADDYAQQSRQAGNWAPTAPPTVAHPAMEEENSGRRNLLISVIALVVLALLAAGVYWFSLRHKPATPSPSASNSTKSASSTSQLKTHIDSTTKTYNSPNFNLAFSYPADWTVIDNGGGTMTVKSPVLILDAGNATVRQGIIILTVRSHGQTLPEFSKGNATATRDSLKVTYAKPTQTQRASTYLSFLQYAQTTTAGSLDGIYIAGDNGYQKGQTIPGPDVAKADPIISITFTDGGKAMSITDKSWDDTNLSGPLVKMLESFAIN